jgi:mRNA interferase YafQ
MRPIERSTQFKRDYKKASKSIHSSELDSRLTEVIGYLVLDCQPPPRFRDHQLKADWKGYRDCHVFPGLILIYQLKADCILRLARLGSHSELSL